MESEPREKPPTNAGSLALTRYVRHTYAKGIEKLCCVKGDIAEHLP